MEYRTANKIGESVEEEIIVCFDFDGVCHQYTEWRGFDVLGEAVEGVADLVRQLRQRGVRVILWTTRLVTPTVIKWLSDNGFEFDSINSTSHNPECTSQKPLAHLYVDDRSLRFWQDEPERSCQVVMKFVEMIRTQLRGRESQATQAGYTPKGFPDSLAK